jgi:GT2 family glycosyltransferase
VSSPGEAVERPPRVSVAVSTYQRAAALPRLVEALERQTLPLSDFEVVIADNGATDDTPAVLRRLQAESLLDIRVVRAEKNRGPAAGRNLAWRAAHAPTIAFTDDDCRPQPDWLAAGLTALAGAAVVVGRTEPPPEQLWLEDGPFARVVRVEEARFFETCNVFYRRSDLEAAGGFDETFLTPAGEDTDLALRIRPRGEGVVFAPDALVYHDIRPSDFVAAAREALRWTDIPRVIRLHPEMRARLLHGRFFWRASHPRAIAAFAGIMLALSRRSALPLSLTFPWLHYRVVTAPLCPGPRRRWLVLAPGLVLDLIEVGVMARGSVRHRTLVL